MTRKVTVITLVYNGLPYLKEAVESTLNQTYSEFDYLIIDDCSPDQNIEEFIKTYRDSRIKFIRNNYNLGVANSFNKALEISNTEYIIRLDQDDISLPNRIEEQIDFLESNKNISIVCSWEHTINSSGEITRDWKKSIKNYGEFIGPVLLGLCPIWHPSIAFRKDDMIKVGGFRKEYTRAEDFEVTARMARNRFEASIVPRFHLLQRHHETSQSSEFIEEQERITRIIQEEAISDFLTKDDASELACFMKFEFNPKKHESSKEYVLRMKKALLQMIANIIDDRDLTKDETDSLNRIIYRRLGFGIRLVEHIRYLPKILFLLIFFILSPLYSHRLHNIASYFYNLTHELKYSILKIIK